MTKPPSAHSPLPLLFFVASEPELAPGVRETHVGPGHFHLSSILLASGVLPRTLEPGYVASLGEPDPFELPPLTDHRAWRLPAPQMYCLESVLEAVQRQRQTVLVIDVNRPDEHRALIEKWVRPSDVLPLLVRPDGARLRGEENFAASKVRRFLAGK